jgi:hypothetical protein
LLNLITLFFCSAHPVDRYRLPFVSASFYPCGDETGFCSLVLLWDPQLLGYPHIPEPYNSVFVRRPRLDRLTLTFGPSPLVILVKMRNPCLLLLSVSQQWAVRSSSFVLFCSCSMGLRCLPLAPFWFPTLLVAITVTPIHGLSSTSDQHGPGDPRRPRVRVCVEISAGPAGTRMNLWEPVFRKHLSFKQYSM